MQVNRKYKWLLFAVILCMFSLLLVEGVWHDSRQEESYRNDAALTMMETGNYSVAYQFGERYLKKPPGLNWLILLASYPFGTVTDFSARLPIIFLYFLFPLTVFWLLRNRFSPETSLTASLASVLYLPWFIEKGPIMEIDLVFTYFVFLSMALWIHYHELEKPYQKWTFSQLAASAAFMIKGPVIFVFFYPSIIIYQYLYSDNKTTWRAFSLGLIVFLTPILIWVLATLRQVTMVEWWRVTVQEMSGPARRGAEFGKMVEHFLKFPFASFFSYLPWILLLLPLLSKSFRQQWWKLRSRQTVLSYSISTLPIWFLFYALPAADVRYILPLYPWLGILCCSVLELNTDVQKKFQKWTIRGSRFLGGILLLAGGSLPFILPDAHQISHGILASTVGLLMVAGAIVLSISVSERTFLNLAAGCLIFIVVLKMAHLFTFFPADEPEVFTREDYSRRIARHLQRNQITPCLGQLSQWNQFYLHQKGIPMKRCKQDNSYPDHEWILTQKKYETKTFSQSETFKNPHHPTVYLYRQSD